MTVNKEYRKLSLLSVNVAKSSNTDTVPVNDETFPSRR